MYAISISVWISIRV